MTMKNFLIPFAAVVFLLMKGVMLHRYTRSKTSTTQIPSITRCDQLPRDILNFTSVVLYSPFFVYRSTDANHQCAIALGTGLEANNNITFLITKGNSILTKFALDPQDNQQDSLAIDCENGANSTYHFIVYNHNSRRQYMCPYACSADGTTIEILRCYGHTSADEAEIQYYLETFAAKVPGYDKILNTQENCGRAPYCSNFDA